MIMAWSRRPPHSTGLLLPLLLCCSLFHQVSTQVSVNEISGFSLSPPYFNLAEGSSVSATATCGEDHLSRPRSDLYCKLVGGPAIGVPSQTIQGQFCDYCNANDPDKAHPVTNAIDGTERWWQSPPLSRGLNYNEVNVTLDLGQLFHVAYVIVKFANSPRPDLWVLERSVDNGRTFTPWQYFAHLKRDCIERFGKQPNARVRQDNDQICTTEYSKIVPLENGEIVVSLVNGRPGSKNFTYSPVLQEFTKATNIRLHFLRTNTLLGHLISKAQRDPTVTRRYYYSIKDISVGGRCVCHGHAQVCGVRVPGRPKQLLCECEHNTCGESCDRCCPGFHQKQWRPATANSPNECEPCQCHSHSAECRYDAEVERRGASLNIHGRYDGGGVCINCRHNTAGVNCELCAEGYYRPYGVPRESPTGCISCRCDPRTTMGCEMGTGRCLCKPQYSGSNCERCASGYYGYPQCIPYPVIVTTTKSPAGNIYDRNCPVGYFGAPRCQPCDCEQRGSVPEVCTASGRCLCRPGVTGERCDRCLSGYLYFPNCRECRCDGPGVADQSCGLNGQCRCRAHFAGLRCDQCAEGYYGYPVCRPCQCSREGSLGERCDQESGQCDCRDGVTGPRCECCISGDQRFPYCSDECRCDGPGVADPSCGPNGQCRCRSNFAGLRCEQCAAGYYGYPVCRPCQCSLEGSREEICDQRTGQCVCRPGVRGQRCERCSAEDQRFPYCSECRCDGPGVSDRSCGPNGQCRCLPNFAGLRCDQCAAGYYSYPNCRPCQCSREGTCDESCDLVTGQCVCRPGITGQRCDRCIAGDQRFPYCSGSNECRCDGPGVSDRSCGPNGQCRCLPNFAGLRCDQCAAGYYSYPNCRPCQCSPEGSRNEICDQRMGQCVCRAGVRGQRCERCSAEDQRFPYCSEEECRCDGPGVADPSCGLNGQCRCQLNFAGLRCDQCAAGFYKYPNCRACKCSPEGSQSEVCDQRTGQCVCIAGVAGQRCERCVSEDQRFPYCSECRCDGPGVIDQSCGPNNQCYCRFNFAGLRCEQCAEGYYSYPNCRACQCSREGSLEDPCDMTTGQCVCRPGVTGQRCDRCVAEGLNFPDCIGSGNLCNPAGSQISAKDPTTDSCICLPHVEGSECERCKPLYWNLTRENQNGCVECSCDVKGTQSGVGECEEGNGECFCKPNICNHACSKCKDGYFLLQKKNYFGCEGCQCDVGGAVASGCEESTGQCKCRKHMQGRTCSEPQLNYYLPSLHHLKFEVENGITPNARQVRFGYDLQEFPEFSWRGYAMLTPAQPEVVLFLVVGSPGPFHIVVRYATAGLQGAVRGRLLLVAGKGFYSHCDWSGESKEVVFPPSRSPAFLTVPGDGFAQPFTLTPRKWIICLKAEGILLDYLVLLPSAYYEAPILQHHITEPCTYLAPVERGNCLLYKHVPIDSFPSALASQGRLSVLSPRRKRLTQARRNQRQPTADHPTMMAIRGRQAQLRLTLHVPESGSHVLILEYASEVNVSQNANLFIGSQPEDEVQMRATIYSCAYSFLCRSVVVDRQNRIAHVLLPAKAEILLQTFSATFMLYRVYAVPSADFTMELINPKVLCVSVHGHFSDDSEHCVQSQFNTPSTAVVLDTSSVIRPTRLTPPSSGRCDGLLLKYPQTEAELSTQLPQAGRYVFIVQYCQPEHTTFPVEVLLNMGNTWTGYLNASFCPAVSGCRSVVIADRRIILDAKQQTLVITLKIPKGRTLTLDYILAVPEEQYSPDLLRAKPLDKASDFISQCGSQGFYIHPDSASPFCEASARSVVAHYYNGALPCECDKMGSTSPTCEPMGGQCSCRPHVIGRQCTRCATGFFGFPYCRRCECGQRLCDEVTGECICPPQTVRPACEVCVRRTFSYHPLLGCEGCDCSPIGITTGDTGQCHVTTGQCTCKPRIGGRQCSQCVSGYYSFPECLRCSCNAGGVTPQICDPNSGQCLCKTNVEGPRCDTCRKGSFHFDPANPKGCTKCFCFGATEQCRSSEKRRGKFVDMRSWRLMSSDLEEVPSVLNSLSDTVVADVQELPVSVRQLHWVLPQSYLGDRVSSYGGYLTYQMKSFGLPREGMRLLDKQPDVILKGQKMTLVYQDPQSPSPDRLYQGRVQLVEGNFRHSGTNRPASREELMRVLSRLEAVWIRALYFSQSQRLSIGEVGMEVASPTGRGGPASTVEVCSCPPQYTGDSCQRCSRGFYRDRSSRCVPCVCNGLSDDCEESTGRCLNCQYNTAGDHCERCKEGYYGSAALRTCKICPCPLPQTSNNFAVGCTELLSGRFQCQCKAGYTGERCERCAPGYYGDPEVFGGRCRPCNCNGNSCSPKTGACNNGQVPKDIDPEVGCQECDNCAQTLLNDLDRLEEELLQIKADLDNMNSSSSAYIRLKKLEEAIADTKNVVTDYGAAVDRLSPKVTELERDALVLTGNIKLLNDKAENRSKDAQAAAENIEKTHEKAKALYSQTLDLLAKINELLKLMQNTDWPNGSQPSGDVNKLLAEAERLVKEMQGRNLKPQNDAAVKELDEAQKLLEYVKNNCTKQYNQNLESATRIKDQLNNYEAKLKELEAALKEASSTVQRANNQNGLNNKTLSDVMEKMKKLQQEKDSVSKEIVLAKQQLNATEDLLKMLSDSKKEYEQLAAQLDGAKTDLTSKINTISQAAAKEGLVKRAEDHAAMLSKLANDLQQAVKNSSGRTDVQNALSAIDAYRNITEAVKAAEEAARRAKEAADKALNDITQGDVTNRAKDLKDESNRLLKDAKNAAKDLKQATEDLTNQKQRLDDAERKKDVLNKELAAINTDLSGIKRDDIGRMIDAAKRTAADASASANDTLDKLNAIKDEISKFKATPSSSNVDGLLSDVDMTVKNLSTSIPSLLDKISQVEKLSSEIDPNNNISNNINRIKDLIEQARAAANRIMVPMKFNGDGYVELRAPKDLDDLRAYTALSILLQRPEDSRGDDLRRRRQTSPGRGNLFVLYLGNRDATKDYIGMALKSNILVFVYKLNGKVYEMETDSITPSKGVQSFFDRVDLQRVYQDARIKLTKAFTSTNPPEPQYFEQLGEPLQNLLNLDPSEVVFYVGGYPDDFTPPAPLQFPKYKGCIEFSSMNEKFISLYNFKSVKPANTTLPEPCKRYFPPSNDYFEGSGYIKANFGASALDRVLIFQQTFESKAQNALLMYISNETTSYWITIERGHFVIRGRVNGKFLQPNITAGTYKLSGDLMVIFQNNERYISVRWKRVAVLQFQYTPESFNTYYIGGIPKELRERDNISTVPLKGCVSNLEADRSSPTIVERVGVGRGCYPDLQIIRKAEFHSGSSLKTPAGGFDLSGDVALSLGFRSTDNDGVLLQNRQAISKFELTMQNGFVMLDFLGSMWKSKKQYQDGEWHYLTVVKNGQNVEFRIDEDDVGERVTSSTSSANSDLIVLGDDLFTGCMSNLYMRRPESMYRPEDFSNFNADGNVFLDLCDAARPPENMLTNPSQSGSQNEKKDQKENNTSSCFTPTPVPHSLRLAGASSTLSYTLPTPLSNGLSFSLDVRTKSAEGLLLYIPAKQDSYHLALYVSRGRIRLSMENKGEIFNRETYNDGKWHTVTLSLEKRRYRLVIDGLRAQDRVLNPGEVQRGSTQLSSNIYLGTPPPSIHEDLKRKKLPDQAVFGCVRDFKMNDLPMPVAAVNRGVGPCFEGHSESGAYFSQGAYVIVDNSFVLGQRFELVFELRPSKQSGLLLHVGTHNHLTVFMRRGEVVAQVNNGGGEFSVAVQPKQSLCDGVFHRIAVIQRNNVVEMHVDTEGKYTIGPTSSSSNQDAHPVYVGGVPDRLKFSLPVTEPYVGCVQNIIINGDVVIFEKLSGVFGPVNLRECPVNLRRPRPSRRVKSVPLK
ncbi:laminin subunit alpha-3 isoform X9 [Astyanax mexicanus]|uniref:laminin subunit alpha-3 isoform X9 n=1 Tax=Astyanax mexicanus TaxID=7994 RepID=UPI0020CAB6FB|nr:laminin subunit alpha-3 isoform X9 [Astyanax mexicanus]